VRAKETATLSTNARNKKESCLHHSLHQVPDL
jgi:hypothetical protein